MPPGQRTTMPAEQACGSTTGSPGVETWVSEPSLHLVCRLRQPRPIHCMIAPWHGSQRRHQSCHTLTAQPVPSILQTFLVFPCQQLNVVHPLWEQYPLSHLRCRVPSKAAERDVRICSSSTQQGKQAALLTPSRHAALHMLTSRRLHCWGSQCRYSTRGTGLVCCWWDTSCLHIRSGGRHGA